MRTWLAACALFVVITAAAATLPQKPTQPPPIDLPSSRPPNRTCSEFTEQLVVKDSGEVEIRTHQKCRPLTDDGLTAAKFHVYTDMEVLAAWQIDAAGEKRDAVIAKRKLQDGNTAIGVSFAGLKVGDQYVIDTYNVAKGGDRKRGVVLSYESTAPLDTLSVEVDAPSGTVQVADADFGTPNYQKAGGREHWTWHAAGLPQLAPDPGLELVDLRPRVAIGLDRDFPATMRELARRYEQAESASRRVPGIARTLARPGDSTRARASAALTWLHQNLEYTSERQFVDSTLLPTPVDESLARGKGMCRDQVAVYAALLHALGVRVEPVFLGSVDFWQPAIPLSLHWNHVIVYLPELDLFVDPSDAEWPVGMLNFQLAYHRGYDIDQQKWMDIPYDSAWQSESEVADMTIDASGQGHSTTQLRFVGELAGAERRDIDEDIAAHLPDRRAGRLLKWVGMGGTGTVTPIETGEPKRFGYDISYAFDGSKYLAAPNPLPGVPSFKNYRLAVNLDERYTHSVCVPTGLNQQITLRLPQGSSIARAPQAMHLANAAGEYSSNYRVEGAQLVATRSLQVHWSRPICTPADMDLLTQLESFAASDRAQTISLARGGAPERR